jgi:phage gp29-like protein
MPDEERRRLLDVLEGLQTDAGVVVPESISLRLLESAHRGNGSTYREMADWCNDEMSKAVLGATLTSGEGRRSGSLALGTVHNAVRQDYIEADARLLADLLNETFVRWTVELNLPAGTPSAHWTIDAAPPRDLEQQVRIDAELVRLGVPVALSHFHERYGRPVPRPGESVLRYDDANLFQYHLQYGVLTINEVRARLQLPPVPWGEERTRALGDEQAPTRLGGPSREEAGRGEALADAAERRAERETRGP